MSKRKIVELLAWGVAGSFGALLCFGVLFLILFAGFFLILAFVEDRPLTEVADMSVFLSGILTGAGVIFTAFGGIIKLLVMKGKNFALLVLLALAPIVGYVLTRYLGYLQGLAQFDWVTYSMVTFGFYAAGICAVYPGKEQASEPHHDEVPNS